MTADPFNLQRFVDAQERVHETALREIHDGRKRTHWMWFIFPQIDGLGSSATTKYYSIKSKAEAAAYLNHPILGPRLITCAQALLEHEGKTAHDIMGSPDDAKLRSCATLFAAASEEDSVFHRLLNRFFVGVPDDRTVELMG